jgi:hypothetical protein
MGIFGATTFPAVPAPYLAIMQSLKGTTGIPVSWLAAVSQASGFNPAYITRNSPSLDVRQIGIAGIYEDLPEIQFTVIHGQMRCPCCNVLDGGWNPFSPSGVPCACDAYHLSGTSAQQSLSDAAAILVNCTQGVQATFGFGSLNLLVFYRYVLGCFFVPAAGPGGLPIVPSIPPVLQTAIWTLIEAQAYYAPQFGEDAVLSNPGPTPDCAPGFTWNSTTGLCCNSLSQCHNAGECPTGTQLDSATFTCQPVQCGPSFPCLPPLVCQADGTCQNICSQTRPCAGAYVCSGGTCVSPCDPVSNPCPAPYYCVGGLCISGCGSGPPCASSQTCTNGTCVNNCGTGGPCTPPLICVQGACVQPPCDPVTNPCPSGQTCINGACLTDCGQGAPCTAPAVCQNGSCVSPCTDISHCAACPTGQTPVCVNGVCGCTPVQPTGGISLLAVAAAVGVPLALAVGIAIAQKSRPGGF